MLSEASIVLIIINAVVPLVYAYASVRGNSDLAEKTLDLLMALPPENNTIIRGWSQFGIKADSALRSQALIHLRKEYCDKRECLSCRWGHQLLRREILG